MNGDSRPPSDARAVSETEGPSFAAPFDGQAWWICAEDSTGWGVGFVGMVARGRDLYFGVAMRGTCSWPPAGCLMGIDYEKSTSCGPPEHDITNALGGHSTRVGVYWTVTTSEPQLWGEPLVVIGQTLYFSPSGSSDRIAVRGILTGSETDRPLLISALASDDNRLYWFEQEQTSGVLYRRLLAMPLGSSGQESELLTLLEDATLVSVDGGKRHGSGKGRPPPDPADAGSEPVDASVGNVLDASSAECDGTHLYWLVDNAGVYRVAVGGGSAEPVAQNPDVSRFALLGEDILLWLSDGIVRMRKAGGELVRVVEGIPDAVDLPRGEAYFVDSEARTITRVGFSGGPTSSLAVDFVPTSPVAVSDDTVYVASYANLPPKVFAVAKW